MPSTLLCVCTRICKFGNIWAKVTISVSVPQVPNLSIQRHLNILFCTGVTSWVIINKFHVIKNDPHQNIHDV